MEENNYQLEEFKSFLLTNNINENEVPRFISAIKNFIQFLEKKNETISSFSFGKLIEYADTLASKDKQEARDLIVGLWRYFPFIEKHHYIEELIDIAESSSAMETLYDRIAEWHGETVRNEIFKDITIPPLGAHPEKKPHVTKIVMNRLEEKLGTEKTIELLRPCLHGGPLVGKDKEKFQKLKDLDEFLIIKHQEFVNEVEKHRNDGTAMFAQLVDDEVLDYVKTIPTMGAGVRDDNKIIITKIPYQIKKFLNANSDSMKRYYWCYCPWVRGSIKDGTEKEISRNFCYCSGGYFKLYWDEMFDQSIDVEPLQTALWGDMVCKFAIEIPNKIMKEYVQDL
ncbi:MAG: hypothetical protein JSW11_09140 [Candidatus Heimdallarchaeota archaeon]|nr:MAG: hypothetical protein JSW11_09140 [Candidatus Heimdallarchaeota archaeon]